MPGPYGVRQNENPVQMVRHEGESVQHNVVEMPGDLLPAGRHRHANQAGADLAVLNLSEQAAPP